MSVCSENSFHLIFNHPAATISIFAVLLCHHSISSTCFACLAHQKRPTAPDPTASTHLRRQTWAAESTTSRASPMALPAQLLLALPSRRTASPSFRFRCSRIMRLRPPRSRRPSSLIPLPCTRDTSHSHTWLPVSWPMLPISSSNTSTSTSSQGRCSSPTTLRWRLCRTFLCQSSSQHKWQCLLNG